MISQDYFSNWCCICTLGDCIALVSLRVPTIKERMLGQTGVAVESVKSSWFQLQHCAMWESMFVFAYVWGAPGGSVVRALGPWLFGCELKSHQVQVFPYQKKNLICHNPSIPSCKWGPTQPWLGETTGCTLITQWGPYGTSGTHTKVVAQTVLL